MHARSLIGITFMSALLGCGGRQIASSDIVIPIGDRKVVFAADAWSAMPNEAEFARNFESLTNKPPRQYQIVTIFLNHMSEDRRSGQLIAANEYLEAFLSNPNEITVLLRRDHDSYWLLSREMFRGVSVPGVDQGHVRPLPKAESEQVAASLRTEIDNTRFLLGEQLRAR